MRSTSPPNQIVLTFTAPVDLGEFTNIGKSHVHSDRYHCGPGKTHDQQCGRNLPKDPGGLTLTFAPSTQFAARITARMRLARTTTGGVAGSTGGTVVGPLSIAFNFRLKGSAVTDHDGCPLDGVGTQTAGRDFKSDFTVGATL